MPWRGRPASLRPAGLALSALELSNENRHSGEIRSVHPKPVPERRHPQASRPHLASFGVSPSRGVEAKLGVAYTCSYQSITDL